MQKKEGKGKKDQVKQTENKQRDGRFKSNHINNHRKLKWSKCFNLKAEIEKLD